MIAIDFQGGAHGNFLEVVCNVMAGIKLLDTPFNRHGAAHNKLYLSDQIFRAGHYSFLPEQISAHKVISIQITQDDLLPLSQISLLRAGDRGLDNQRLEINTYNKLNNIHYRSMLDTLLKSFFENQVYNSYAAVKDPSWPDVYTIDDFNQLPEHIQQECKQVHGLELLECNQQSPDCPRHILREFFEIGFSYPEQNMFLRNQQLMQYPGLDVYVFPYASFYHSDQFQQQLKQIASWAQIEYNSAVEIKDLHNEFLNRQPYADSKNRCDALVQQMIQDAELKPSLTMIEEAYVNSVLTRLNYERRY